MTRRMHEHPDQPLLTPLPTTVGSTSDVAHAPAAGTRMAENQAQATDQRLVLSILEACQALGIGETTLRQLLACGRLPVLRLGRRVLIPRAAVEALVAEAAVSGSGAQPWRERPHQ